MHMEGTETSLRFDISFRLLVASAIVILLALIVVLLIELRETMEAQRFVYVPTPKPPLAPAVDEPPPPAHAPAVAAPTRKGGRPRKGA